MEMTEAAVINLFTVARIPLVGVLDSIR